MCNSVYGAEDPSNDMVPRVRSNTLGYWKKGISYFMDTTAKWHEATKTGNATQSKKVNNLIKAVVRAETRGTGQETVADRAFTVSELKQILHLMPEHRYRAMMCFQYHLIGRGDDTAHVRKDVLKVSTEFRGYLTAKIRWSKNVADESACPEQILIPSMDTRTCVYFSLALWLEHWIQYGEGTLSQWMFVDGVATRQSSFEEQDKEARIGNSKYRAAIKRIVECNTFKSTNTVPGILGSHSIRKLATSEIRRRGVPKDDIDYRARWKSATRMQDRYTDIQLNWPDVNAASNLCLGGACTYKVKQDAGITDDWVANNCAVGITSVFGVDVGAILGKVLLWASHDELQQESVSADIRHRCVTRFIALQREGLGNDYNPVEKVEVIASEAGGTVNLDEYEVEPTEDRDVLLSRTRESAQWRAAVYARLGTTSKEVSESHTLQLEKFTELQRAFRRMERMVKEIATSPARSINGGVGVNRNRTDRGTPIRVGAAAQGQDIRPATLCRNPKTLSLLWEEYLNGIGGRLPAQQFTREQRGVLSVRANYCNRKGFWDCMQRMVDKGLTEASALARISRVYEGPITQKLRAIRKDERNGGHALCEPNRRRRRRENTNRRIAF